MALVHFNCALVLKLGEKPRLLPTSPAVARPTFADPGFLPLQNGYVCVQLRYDLTF
jgi:molecular chaperone DnaJ